MNFDSDALLAELTTAAERSREGAPRLISFAVLPEDEEAIEEAISRAMSELTGGTRAVPGETRRCGGLHHQLRLHGLRRL